VRAVGRSVLVGVGRTLGTSLLGFGVATVVGLLVVRALGPAPPLASVVHCALAAGASLAGFGVVAVGFARDETRGMVALLTGRG
jgi:hypothetical protein